MNNILPYFFWIDHYSARLKLVELVFAKTDWSKLYTLNNFEDFIFRYEDLLPWAVVLDEKQFPMENTMLRDFIIKEKIKIIHITEENETLEFANLSIGKISRILNPMQLPGIIQSIFLKAVGNDKHH